jgi:hypothetical protein
MYSCHSLLRGSCTSCAPRLEKPWHGGPPMITDAFGISESGIEAMSAHLMWSSPKFAAYVAAACRSHSTAMTGSNPPAATNPDVMPPQPANKSIIGIGCSVTRPA